MTDSTARRPYEQDDAFRSRHVLDGVLSPDGRFAVYELSEVVPGKTSEEDASMSSLWRVDLVNGKSRRLTAKGRNATSPQLTPDGGAVLFLSARGTDGKIAQVCRLPVDGGEAEQVSAVELGVIAYALSPDGQWIAYTAVEKAPPGPDEHVRIDRAVFRLDAVPGYLHERMQAIYLMPANGGEARALTPHDGLFAGLCWSPDSSRIAAVVTGREQHKSSPLEGDLLVADRNGRVRTLIGEFCHIGPQIVGMFWTRDGKSIGIAAYPKNRMTEQLQLYLVDSESGERVSRTPTFDRCVGRFVLMHNPAVGDKCRPVLTADGSAAILPIMDGGEAALYAVALSGAESVEPVVSGKERVCQVLDRVGDTLLFLAQGINAPSELFAFDLATAKQCRLTHHNDEWLAGIAWPAIEHVKVESAPGVEIEGWVLKPAHVKAPYRTILAIHGGPNTAFGYTFNEDYQELAGAGYAVLFANPRGSTGYGDAFSASIIGRWGHPELEDFHALLDELVRRGVADPDRLGVTGVSGGGHLSAWLIGHTNRFKAAIPEQGVYNMISFYGTSEIGIPFLTMLHDGTLQDRTQHYWDHSPIAHAHRCTTPTLLIQGENDLRCPMEQAEQLFTVLKHHGCEVEFLRLNNCCHALEEHGPPPLRRFRMNAMKDWFDRYIP